MHCGGGGPSVWREGWVLTVYCSLIMRVGAPLTPGAPSAALTGQYVTLSWAAVEGADDYEVQEWNWDGLVSGWYSSRLQLDESGDATNALSFIYNFGSIELPRCGRTVPTPLTSLEVAGRRGLRMEWRVRGRFNSSQDPGPWSAASNTLRMPDGRDVLLQDTCCRAGYMDVSNATQDPQCHACVPGRISSAGALRCDSCPSGTYSGVRATACLDCPAGSPDHDANSSTPCVACEAGRVQPEARASTTCYSCAAGQYAAIRGMTTCTQCSSGEYAAAGSTACTRCPPGASDTDYNASTPCALCEIGQAGGDGDSPCLLCTHGRYSSDRGFPSCAACSVGQYSGANASGCAACEAGQVDLDRNASTQCVLCDPGYFSIYNQSGECTACAPGWYSNVTGTNNTCERCSAGQFAAGFPRLGCTNCTVGWADLDYSPATPCDMCEEGKYADRVRAVSCLDCGQGLWSDGGTGECWVDNDPYRHFSTFDFIMKFAVVPGCILIGAVLCWVGCKKAAPYAKACCLATLHAVGLGCLVTLLQRLTQAIVSRIKHKLHAVHVVAHKVLHALVVQLRKLPCCKCLPIPPPPPPPPARKYLTKAEKKAAALKFGRRWAEETRNRRLTAEKKLRIQERGVRVARKFDEPVSPERLAAGVNSFSPHRLKPLAIRAPPVAAETVQEFRLYKSVNETEEHKDATQRSMIHRHLKSGTTQSASLKAWAAYHGWGDPRAGHPSSWAAQEAALKKQLSAEHERRMKLKETRQKVKVRKQEETAEREAAALSAEEELAMAKAQIQSLTQQLHMGKSIAEVTIAELEARLEHAEQAMAEASLSIDGLSPSPPIRTGVLPGEVSAERRARRKEKEEMRKKLEAMGVKPSTPIASSFFAASAGLPVWQPSTPVWGLHYKHTNTRDVVAEAEEALGSPDSSGSPLSMEQESLEYQRQVAERTKQQKQQEILEYRAAEVRRQLESMKAIAWADDDNVDDGGFSDGFESLFNSLRDEYIVEELKAADHRKAKAQLWSDDEEEDEAV